MNAELAKIIKTWNEWAKNSNLEQRPEYSKIKANDSMAQALIGVRRSGKTSISIINALKTRLEFCYINFEDPFFVNNNNFEILDQIPICYEEIYGKKPKLLILDEIQKIKLWERWLRKIIDTESFKVFITGSSAELLSSEIATSLTGRSLENKIWPFSFKEYLAINKSKDKNKVFKKYIKQGGFPKIVLQRQNESETLISYLRDIIYKDILSRFEIRELATLESIVQYILTNISSKHSANSIKNAFGLTNTNLISEYLEYCESAFLLFLIKKYDRNLKVQTRNPRKAYCIDTGLRQANAFYHSLDEGKLVENIVFIELKRRDKTIYYHQGDYEVDFLVLESQIIKEAINVCYSNLEKEETYLRETNGMLECLKEHGLEQGTILTKSRNEEIILDNRKIIFKPVIDFLLS